MTIRKGEEWGRVGSVPSGCVPAADEAELHRLVNAEPLPRAIGLLGGDLGRTVSASAARERLTALLMLGLYRSGRQQDALDAFRATRSRLRDELGLEPGPELRDLEQRILRHDPSDRKSTRLNSSHT